jgi:hypothetical protein
MTPGTIPGPRPHPADGQLVPPETGGAPGRTPRQDRSPTPSMNGDTTLVVSEGQLPANSRHATSTRESQSGSGSSHDPAPAHHPHPPRSPPVSIPAQATGVPARWPQDRTSSLRCGRCVLTPPGQHPLPPNQEGDGKKMQVTATPTRPQHAGLDMPFHLRRRGCFSGRPPLPRVVPGGGSKGSRVWSCSGRGSPSLEGLLIVFA